MDERVSLMENERSGRRVRMCEEVYEEVKEIERMSSIVKTTTVDLVCSMFRHDDH